MHTAEPSRKTFLGDKHFIPSTEKNCESGLHQNETDNYYGGYKNIILTLKLNLITFFNKIN
jgi:hypothetical protein